MTFLVFVKEAKNCSRGNKPWVSDFCFRCVCDCSESVDRWLIFYTFFYSILIFYKHLSISICGLRSIYQILPNSIFVSCVGFSNSMNFIEPPIYWKRYLVLVRSKSSHTLISKKKPLGCFHFQNFFSQNITRKAYDLNQN